MVCWAFVASEVITVILNIFVIIRLWRYVISAAKKTEHKVMYQVDEFSERISASPATLKTIIWTVGCVFLIFNETLIQM